MSSTRTAAMDAPLSQERWASSPAFARSLKANLVALRCSLLASQADRELIWHLQYLSGIPDALYCAAMACAPLIVKADDLRELCLNPESDLLATLAPMLRPYLAARVQTVGGGGVVTEIGSQVREALDYCHAARGVVLISGKARTGKTFSAQHWCEQNPGRARFVQVPSTADDLAFLMAIARALGITIESNAKTKNLRPRIETALQGGDLMLVLDDAQFCWPGHNYRLARPSRICWLMTALINHRVPVALIGTEQFFQAQAEYVKKTGWAAAQLIGRIERFVSLPDSVSLADLARVARAWLPKGEPKFIEALAHYANLSAKHLAAIEHVVKRARYLAQQAGRNEVEWPDLKAAITESVQPSDSRLAALMARTGYTRRNVAPSGAFPADGSRGVRVECVEAGP